MVSFLKIHCVHYPFTLYIFSFLQISPEGLPTIKIMELGLVLNTFFLSFIYGDFWQFFGLVSIPVFSIGILSPPNFSLTFNLSNSVLGNQNLYLQIYFWHNLNRVSSCWIIPVLFSKRRTSPTSFSLEKQIHNSMIWGITSWKILFAFMSRSYTNISSLQRASAKLKSPQMPAFPATLISSDIRQISIHISCFHSFHLIFSPGVSCPVPYLSSTKCQGLQTFGPMQASATRTLCSSWLQYLSLRAYSSQDYHQLMLPGRGKCILTT